jgi:serine/threonine-protein kinase
MFVAYWLRFSRAPREHLMASPDPPPYQVPDVIGSKYRLVKVLGQGGMSVVFDAVDTTCERSVAVKVIRPRLAARLKFSAEQMRREAEVLVRLREKTEFVVDVLTAGITADAHALPYYVMERLRGDTLRQFIHAQIKRGVEFTIDEITTIGIAVAMALAHAHTLGVVHRDTKPDNVFMAAMWDDRVVVKVLDFGICALADDQQKGFSGTVPYAAPEQLGGAPAHPASDVYALGLILFELATLKLPHGRHRKGLAPEVLTLAVMKSPVPDVSLLRLDAPPRLTELIARCLVTDPAQRPTAHDVAKGLRDIRHSFLGQLGGTASTSVPATDVSGPPTGMGRGSVAPPPLVHRVAPPDGGPVDPHAATVAPQSGVLTAQGPDEVFFRSPDGDETLEAKTHAVGSSSSSSSGPSEPATHVGLEEAQARSDKRAAESFAQVLHDKSPETWERFASAAPSSHTAPGRPRRRKGRRLGAWLAGGLLLLGAASAFVLSRRAPGPTVAVSAPPAAPATIAASASPPLPSSGVSAPPATVPPIGPIASAASSVRTAAPAPGPAAQLPFAERPLAAQRATAAGPVAAQAARPAHAGSDDFLDTTDTARPAAPKPEKRGARPSGADPAADFQTTE